MTSTDHTVKCQECGRARRFRTAEAAAHAKPAGRVCAMRVKLRALAEAAAGFKDDQITKARNLIASGGLTRSNRDRIWFAKASDGHNRYRVNTEARSCECKAGQRAMRCYHLLAALLTEVVRRLALAAA